MPGSHKLTTDEFDALLPADGIGQPEGAIPVLAKAGQVMLFDRRLRHAATPNWSDRTRKAYFVGYSYRWLKPKVSRSCLRKFRRDKMLTTRLICTGRDVHG